MDHTARMLAPGPSDAVSAVLPLSVGQELDCSQDFKAVLYEWVVGSGHPVRLDKSGRLRNLFCCKTSADCELKERAIWKAIKEKVITLLVTY